MTGKYRGFGPNLRPRGDEVVGGLRFIRPTHALIFRLLANGFRSADLPDHLTTLPGRAPPETIGRGTMTYQLRRLDPARQPDKAGKTAGEHKPAAALTPPLTTPEARSAGPVLS